MATATVLPTLGNIVRDTQHFIQNASAPQPRSPTCRSSVIPQLYLPDPPPLYPSLIAIGAEEKIASEMNHAYNARALELRSYYEKSITNAFAALTDFPFPRDSENRISDTFATLYLTKVKSWIEEGVAAYQGSRKQAKQVARIHVMTKDATPRRTFNTVCFTFFIDMLTLMVAVIGLYSPSGTVF